MGIMLIIIGILADGIGCWLANNYREGLACIFLIAGTITLGVGFITTDWYEIGTEFFRGVSFENTCKRVEDLFTSKGEE